MKIYFETSVAKTKDKSTATFHSKAANFLLISCSVQSSELHKEIKPWLNIINFQRVKQMSSLLNKPNQLHIQKPLPGLTSPLKHLASRNFVTTHPPSDSQHAWESL